MPALPAVSQTASTSPAVSPEGMGQADSVRQYSVPSAVTRVAAGMVMARSKVAERVNRTVQRLGSAARRSTPSRSPMASSTCPRAYLSSVWRLASLALDM